MEGFMQTAIYGMYKDGQIVFDEPDMNINNSRVLVAFLDEDPKKSKLMDILNYKDIYGETLHHHD
jgi:hypothetical protein